MTFRSLISVALTLCTQNTDRRRTWKSTADNSSHGEGNEDVWWIFSIYKLRENEGRAKRSKLLKTTSYGLTNDRSNTPSLLAIASEAHFVAVRRVVPILLLDVVFDLSRSRLRYRALIPRVRSLMKSKCIATNSLYP